MRGLVASATVALAVGFAATLASPASAAPALRGTSSHAGFVPRPIAWHACADESLASAGAQCGLLTVPMNYARPDGATVRLAVSRIRHKRGTKYQGVMLVNPGGPGASGLGLATLGQYVPEHAGDGYDWIGFDPRGVGSSVPALACDSTFFRGDRPPYRPTDRTIRDRWLSRSYDYAAACAQSPDHRLFRFVRTVDTVADMESIRRALGLSQINFYGFSYGTYLGEVYATLHPNRVRRFVWDGVVDPRESFYRSNLAQDVAFQRTFDIFFRWLARYHAVYHVGRTLQQVRARYLRAIAELDEHAAEGVLGGDELTDVFTSAGYYVFDWDLIARAWSAYLNRGDASMLLAQYRAGTDTSPGGDNGYAIYLATECTDDPWPADLTTVLADNRRYDRRYPYLTWANGWYNGPCNFWPFPAATPVRVDGRAVRTPILMIEETYDAATPFAGALAARKLFPTSSMIEGYHGSTHAGSLYGVACTDNAIARYLLTGQVPERQGGNRSDKRCLPNPQPDPTSSSIASAAGLGSSRALPTHAEVRR